ncbi:MAG TPA: FtsX-like permease family protein [Anaerolineales bacterium]|nr:FtsX-like permease family protein [Anaerolineales bacterium]
MFLISFSFRRLIRHWRINLLVFTGLVLAGAIAAGLPVYAQQIAAQSLARTQADEPAFSRNILLTAPPSVTTFNAALNQVLIDTLGFLVTGQVEVREYELNAYLAVNGETDPEAPRTPIRLWSFNSLARDTVLLDGRYPDHLPELTGAAALLEPQQLEAAIGRTAADESGLQVGDVIFSEGDGLEFRIVGIVEAVDPGDDRWFADPRPFVLEVVPGLNDDIITTPLLLNPNSMGAYIPGALRYWRLLVDQDLIRPENADRIRAGIENAQAGFSLYGVELTTGIPLILESYLADLRIARITLLLLAAQALIFVFYTLGMITSFMLDRSRTEIAALAGRGARRRQVMTVLAMEGFVLAIPGAALLGPLLVGFAAARWAAWTTTGVIPGPGTAPSPGQDAWLLATAAALIGWIAFVLPGFALTGRGMVEQQRERARPARLSAWQRNNLDLFLLVMSALAYWQLSESGSFILNALGDSDLADPLLLLGPSLLLVAVALAFLRVFPVVLQAVHAYAQRGRGLILPIGLARLAREPVGASRIVLLISLAAGLTVFSISFRDSLDLRQVEIAHYLSGADLRVSTTWTPLSGIAAIDGVRTVSPVYRMRVQGPNGRFVTLLAVDPESFARVAWYPEGTGGDVSIERLMELLAAPTDTGHPPAIFSRSALPAEAGLETEWEHQFSQQFLTFDARGIIEEFPTAGEDFIIVSTRGTADWVRLADVKLAQGEAWLAIDPERYAAVAAHFPNRLEVYGDSAAQLARFRANILAEGGKRAFALNAVIMSVLSVAGFLLAHYFTAERRALEFGILRAGGLSGFQLLSLLVAEGLIVMVLGLASGTAVGVGLSAVMRPFLSRVFANALSGADVVRIVLDWGAIGEVFGLLAAAYALALLISVFALMRVGLQRSLRLSGE